MLTHMTVKLFFEMAVSAMIIMRNPTISWSEIEIKFRIIVQTLMTMILSLMFSRKAIIGIIA